MNKTLLAVAVALAYSVTPAWADRPGPDPKSDPSLAITVEVNDINVDWGSKAALVSAGSGNSAATSGGQVTNSFTESFNTSSAISRTKLKGEVTNNRVENIGNSASNSGSASGGNGGNGGGAKEQFDQRHVGGGGWGGVGGTGGAGGAAGWNSVSTGNFDMSNTMNNVAAGAAGITVVSQNTGANSLIQQGVTVQANLSIGTGTVGQ